MDWENVAQYIILIPVALFLYVIVMGLFGPTNKEQVEFSHWHRSNKIALQHKESDKNVTKTFAKDCEAELKALNIAVKRGCTERKLDGALVIDKGTSKGLAIQFFGSKDKKDTDTGEGAIKLEFILAPTEKVAQMHLRGKKFETVPIDSNVFDEFKTTMLVNSAPKKKRDSATQFTVSEGILP